MYVEIESWTLFCLQNSFNPSDVAWHLENNVNVTDILKNHSAITYQINEQFLLLYIYTSV